MEDNKFNPMTMTGSFPLNQKDSDGPLKTYLYTSLLNWKAMTTEQKEQACKEMVRIAHEEIELESSDN